jgi:lysozyme
MDLDILKAELVRDEGCRLHPYVDTVDKITIGVGRNLDDVGISEDEAAFLLANDIARVRRDLDDHLPWWQGLDPVRQRVLANMCFNLGIGHLLGFTHTLNLVEGGDFEAAAEAMMASLWARQVGPRAARLADMMRSGVEPGPPPIDKA